MAAQHQLKSFIKVATSFLSLVAVVIGLLCFTFPAFAVEDVPASDDNETDSKVASTTVWMALHVVVRDVEDPTHLIPGATLKLNFVQPGIHGTTDACLAENAISQTGITDRTGLATHMTRASNFHSGNFVEPGDDLWGYQCITLESLPENYEPVGFSAMEPGTPQIPGIAPRQAVGASLPFELIYDRTAEDPFNFTTTFWVRELPGEVSPEEAQIAYPVAPTLEAAACDEVPTLTIPTVTGVRYQRQDHPDANATVTATPEEGYFFESAQELTWDFDLAVSECEEGGEIPLTPAPPAPGTPNPGKPSPSTGVDHLAETGVSSYLPLVAAIAVFLLGAGAATKRTSLFH